MKDKELREYTVFLQTTRKALIDGNPDNVIKAFREFQLQGGNNPDTQHQDDSATKSTIGRGITNPRMDLPERIDNCIPSLAYIPLSLFIEIVLNHHFTNRVSTKQNVPTFCNDTTLLIYSASGFKEINLSDFVNHFKLEIFDEPSHMEGQLDIINRNAKDLERKSKLSPFYEYLGVDYLFDSGDVLPHDFMSKAHVLLVTKLDNDVSDYTNITTVGESYYCFDDNGYPVRCTLTKCLGDTSNGDWDRPFNILYEMVKTNLVYGDVTTSVVTQDLKDYATGEYTEYLPADYSLTNKRYLHVKVGDIVKTVSGIRLKVKSVETNVYKAVISFIAVFPDESEECFIKYHNDGRVLDITHYTDELPFLTYGWMNVAKIVNKNKDGKITDTSVKVMDCLDVIPENKVKFVEGDEFVKHYNVFNYPNLTFYESFSKEDREYLEKALKQSTFIRRVHPSDKIAALSYLSSEGKSGKVGYNVFLAPTILSRGDWCKSISTYLRSKQYSDVPIILYTKTNVVHVIFKTGNGLDWYKITPPEKNLVLNLNVYSYQYKPKQKRYKEDHFSVTIPMELEK